MVEGMIYLYRNMIFFRPALGISWLFASLGALILGIAWDYWVACVGFFLAGFGSNPAITI